MGLGLAPFVLIGLGSFALVSTLNHREVDPAIAPAYSTAVSALETLPGVSCPQETQYRFSQVCRWGSWRMEMVMGTTTVRQVCNVPDEHAIFGGSDWVLHLTPIPGGPSATSLSPVEDAQLRDALGWAMA